MNSLNNEYITLINKDDISFDSSLNEENTCDNFNSSFEKDESNDNNFSISDISDFEDEWNHENNKTIINNKETSILSLSQIHRLIASTLSKLIQNANHYSHSLDETSSFYSETIPSISIYDYLNRIIRYTEIDGTTLVIALIYIDKYCCSFSLQKQISNHIIHKLLFAAIILAIKYNEDNIYNNHYYAEIGGISLQELNKIEYELLVGLNFSVFVDNELFLKYDNALKEHLKGM